MSETLDAEQARQRVLDLLGSAGRTTKAGYYADVQDVCRIALEAMDERDELRAKLAAQQPAADDSLRKAAQAFVDEPYQTDSARFHGLRNDLRAALAAAPAPRQDDALRELRAWLVWGADISEKHRSYSARINPVDVLEKIDEMLAAKPAPAATGDPRLNGTDGDEMLRSWLRHGHNPLSDDSTEAVVAELCRRALGAKP